MKDLTRKSIVLLCTVMCFCFTNLVYSQQTLSQINGWNAYVHLPASYSSTSTSYPTIIFFPGIGEIGTNPAALISNGPGAYISQGWNGNVTVDGNNIEFIVISIQPPAGYPGEYWINEKIQTIKSLYRVNPDKLYLTGLSHGGWCATTYVTGDNYGGPYTYASQVAAVVEVEGVVPDDNVPYPNLFDNFANSGGRLLGFEQAYDNRMMPGRIARMNATRPNSGIYVQTNFGGGGHCCWNQFYGGQGTQPVNFMLDGVSQNLYQWLARQSRNSGANQPPAANAGSNQTITLPASSVTLTGSGTDPDGSIVSYLWTKLSGPATGSITSATTAQTTVTGLTQGVYQFQLKVVDNGGASSTAQVQVSVNAAANLLPIVSAGANQAITLPVSAATLNGTASDPDGSIVSYLWTKLSGPATGSITSSNTAQTTVTGLTQGIYQFQLKVVDNSGATSTAQTQVTVNAAANLLPVVSAGTDQAITLPVSTATLNGTASDPDGSIVSYLWTKLSGPATGNITSSNTVQTTVTGLTQGIYQFQLKVVDNSGATSTAQAQVTVNAAPNQPPVANAGPDQAATLPLSLINLNGSATDPDGSIASYQWSMISGPGCLISNPLSALTSILSLLQGSYSFQLKAIDNLGAVGMDTVVVTLSNPLAIILQPAVNPANTVNGLDYKYYEGSWSLVPDFSALTPVTSGTTSNFNIGLALRTSLFGFSFSGYVNVPADGMYTFYTTSDDGSTLYIDNILTVNNDGLHGATERSGSIGLKAGKHAISGLFFELAGDHIFTVSYEGPGVAKQQIPATQLYRVGAAAVNIPPVASAGPDITITMPASSVTLTGTGTDADGNISSYQWTRVPVTGTFVTAATIASNTNSSTVVSNLTEGVYQFELKVTDNLGAWSADTVQVTVNPAGINLLPAVNPANTVNGLDYKYYEGAWYSLPDFSSVTAARAGTIANFDLGIATRSDFFGATFTGYINVPTDGIYTFYTTSDDGSSLLIDNVPVVNNDGLHAAQERYGTIGLKAGKHAITGSFFELNGGETFYVGYDGPGLTKQLIPSSALYRIGTVSNVAPVANAGANQNITTATTTLTGSGTDTDGTITGYAWTVLSGPAGSSFSASSSASTNVSGLVTGTYQFQLTVTDNAGATASASVQVVVTLPVITTGRTIRVNIFGGINPYTDTKWNNWNIAAGLNTAYLLDENRTSTTVRASLTGDVMIVDNGASYAASSTTPPAQVLRYNSAATSYRYLTFTGLNPAKRYSLEYYGSRANSGNKTLVTIGAQSDTISTDNNVSDFARFTNVAPDAAGIISATISRLGVWTYLAGFTIVEQADAPLTTFRGTSEPATVTEEPTPALKIQKGEDIIETGANTVSVYPNPFSGAFKVQINNKAVGEFVIKLSAQTGQTVFYKKVNKTAATVTETINAVNLAPGSYILQIISVSTGNQTVHKVIKN